MNQDTPETERSAEGRSFPDAVETSCGCCCYCCCLDMKRPWYREKAKTMTTKEEETRGLDGLRTGDDLPFLLSTWQAVQLIYAVGVVSLLQTAAGYGYTCTSAVPSSCRQWAARRCLAVCAGRVFQHTGSNAGRWFVGSFVVGRLSFGAGSRPEVAKVHSIAASWGVWNGLSLLLLARCRLGYSVSVRL